jgi:O-antigen/teichoic acid export membrane protein
MKQLREWDVLFVSIFLVIIVLSTIFGSLFFGLASQGRLGDFSLDALLSEDNVNRTIKLLAIAIPLGAVYFVVRWWRRK